MNMDQYFAPLWLEVGHRKMEAEISLEKERVTAARELVVLLLLARNAYISPFSFLSFSPYPSYGYTCFQETPFAEFQLL